MVFSVLVEPLVKPLVGVGGGVGERRTALAGTRLAQTRLAPTRLGAAALACTALLAVAGAAGQRAAAEIDHARTAARVEFSARNAHQKPAPIPYRVLLETVFLRREDLALLSIAGPRGRLPEAPEFERATLDAHRLRHKRDPVLDPGPGLGRGRLSDRLSGGASGTFLRFQAGVHRSGVPALAAFA